MTHDTEKTPAEPAPALDRNLLDILVCPVTRGPLEYDAARNELISRQLGMAFPIRQGVPVMLVDEARDLEDIKG